VPPGDEAKPISCPICKEMLKSEFLEDDEEWVWRNAVKKDDRVCLISCTILSVHLTSIGSRYTTRHVTRRPQHQVRLLHVCDLRSLVLDEVDLVLQRRRRPQARERKQQGHRALPPLTLEWQELSARLMFESQYIMTSRKHHLRRNWRSLRD
jgi:hypothetical protein